MALTARTSINSLLCRATIPVYAFIISMMADGRIEGHHRSKPS
jgi:hypothetical protein